MTKFVCGLEELRGELDLLEEGEPIVVTRLHVPRVYVSQKSKGDSRNFVHDIKGLCGKLDLLKEGEPVIVTRLPVPRLYVSQKSKGDFRMTVRSGSYKVVGYVTKSNCVAAANGKQRNMPIIIHKKFRCYGADIEYPNESGYKPHHLTWCSRCS